MSESISSESNLPDEEKNSLDLPKDALKELEGDYSIPKELKESNEEKLNYEEEMKKIETLYVQRSDELQKVQEEIAQDFDISFHQVMRAVDNYKLSISMGEKQEGQFEEVIKSFIDKKEEILNDREKAIENLNKRFKK